MKKKYVLLLSLALMLFLACKQDNAQITSNDNEPIKKQAYNRDVAKRPPLGWNSWNAFGKDNINEKVVKETIDAFVNNGLKDAGYEYVIIDGGWRDTILHPDGRLKCHPVKFPNGIKPLADYAHSKGLKLGVHVVPGSHDCKMDRVGGYGHEEAHVKQFVEWGLDFIKLDLCRMRLDDCTSCPQYRFGWSEKTIEDSYKKWSKLLENSGRDILYSISAYTFRDWYPETCNMARITGDIEAKIHQGAFFNKDTIKHKHISVVEISDIASFYADRAGNGYWNDPDMLVVGDHGLNEKEQISHFALWCMMSSPLMLGNDPRHMGDFEKNLITNKEMLAINQDPTEQGRVVRKDERTRIWVKHLKDNKVAVLVLSLDRREISDFNFDLTTIGFDKTAKVRDVVNHEDVTVTSDIISMKLDINESKLFVVSK